MAQNKEQDAVQPGILATLAAGLDLTSKHLWLTLIPVLLDSFLWLGPRLSLRSMLEQFVVWWPVPETTAALSEQLMLLAPRTNLFTTLSVPFLGIPAFMVGVSPAETPLQPQIYELQGAGSIVGLFLLFSLLGLALTAVYYMLIATAVQSNSSDSEVYPTLWLRRIGTVWLRLIILVLGFIIFMTIVYIPLAIISALLSRLSPVLGIGILFIGPFFMIWLVLACFYVPHSLTLEDAPLRQALLKSARLVRFHAATAMGMILAVILLGGITDQILVITDDGSWVTFVGILAHAFISTSLIAATFIYYRDRLTLISNNGFPY